MLVVLQAALSRVCLWWSVVEVMCSNRVLLLLPALLPPPLLLLLPPCTHPPQEQLNDLLASKSKPELWEVLRHLKEFLQADRATAHHYFSERPGLSKVVFQAQVLLGECAGLCSAGAAVRGVGVVATVCAGGRRQAAHTARCGEQVTAAAVLEAVAAARMLVVVRAVRCRWCGCGVQLTNRPFSPRCHVLARTQQPPRVHAGSAARGLARASQHKHRRKVHTCEHWRRTSHAR